MSVDAQYNPKSDDVVQICNILSPEYRLDVA